MSVLSLLGASAGVTFTIVFTILVLVAFVVIVIALWWKEIKQSDFAHFCKAIKKGFCKLFKIGDSGVVKTVYQDKQLNYSGTEFLPIPTKAPTKEFSYEFIGWDKTHVDEHGNTVIKAIYLQKVNEYQVNFYDDDRSTLLRTAVVQCGATIDVSDLTPHKPESKEFSYEFVGWDKDISAIIQSENVYAVYKAIPKKYTYTFFDADGRSIIYQSSAIYGTPISIPPNPEKKSNAKENFEFYGWKNYKDGMVLTKDISFEAIYKVEEKTKQNQTNKKQNSTESQNYDGRAENAVQVVQDGENKAETQKVSNKSKLIKLPNSKLLTQESEFNENYFAENQEDALSEQGENFETQTQFTNAQNSVSDEFINDEEHSYEPEIKQSTYQPKIKVINLARQTDEPRLNAERVTQNNVVKNDGFTKRINGGYIDVSARFEDLISIGTEQTTTEQTSKKKTATKKPATEKGLTKTTTKSTTKPSTAKTTTKQATTKSSSKATDKSSTSKSATAKPSTAKTTTKSATAKSSTKSTAKSSTSKSATKKPATEKGLTKTTTKSTTKPSTAKSTTAKNKKTNSSTTADNV